MKGFFAFIIEAVKKVDWSKQTKPLYVLATCDEETTMLGARHFTESAPFKPDYCIIGEPTQAVELAGLIFIVEQAAEFGVCCRNTICGGTARMIQTISLKRQITGKN